MSPPPRSLGVPVPGVPGPGAGGQRPSTGVFAGSGGERLRFLPQPQNREEKAFPFSRDSCIKLQFSGRLN